MNWFTVGAAVILVLFLLNAVFVYRLRAKRGPMPDEARVPELKRSLSRSRMGAMLLVVGVLLACWGAPIVAPGSALGQAMASPWARASVIPWSMAVAALVAVVDYLLRRRRTAALR